MAKSEKKTTISDSSNKIEKKSSKSSKDTEREKKSISAQGMHVLAQYIKDLSFENPNTPSSLDSNVNPNINVNINVSASSINQEEYEVLLQITIRANQVENVIFNLELTYGGLFKIIGIKKEHLSPFVLIECPRMLFPFARQIICDSTRNGGFPPLMLDPIDFAKLYKKNIENESEQNNKKRTIN